MRAYTSEELHNPAELTELYLDDADVTSEDLPGIVARFPKLKRLYIARNKITDVSPLAGLIDLEYLVLTENQISDVTPLGGLTRLSELDLNDNQISDVSPEAGLINLE